MCANQGLPASTAVPGLPRGRGRLPPEASDFLQRARILDATTRVVAQRGFAAATVRDIHERAGVSRRTFYDAFDNKEDAVLWAFDAAATFAVPQILEAFRQRRQWLAAADAALTTYLGLLDCDRDWATLCLVGLPAAGERARAHRDRVLAPLLEGLAPDSEDLSVATGAIAAVNNAIRARMADHDSLLVEARSDLLPLVVAPFRGQAAARRRGARAAPPVTLRGSRADQVRTLQSVVPPPPDPALRALLERSVIERDGPALWQAVVGLHERRSAGEAVDDEVERLALGGLEGAWFFGLPVDDITGGRPGPWLPSSSRMRCLGFVYEHPGSTAREIREGTDGMHHSTVHRLLAGLREQGFVRRHGGASRAAVWSCTAAGKTLARQAGIVTKES